MRQNGRAEQGHVMTWVRHRDVFQGEPGIAVLPMVARAGVQAEGLGHEIAILGIDPAVLDVAAASSGEPGTSRAER